jgi:hypothetical protein
MAPKKNVNEKVEAARYVNDYKFRLYDAVTVGHARCRCLQLLLYAEQDRPAVTAVGQQLHARGAAAHTQHNTRHKSSSNSSIAITVCAVLAGSARLQQRMQHRRRRQKMQRMRTGGLPARVQRQRCGWALLYMHSNPCNCRDYAVAG